MSRRKSVNALEDTVNDIINNNIRRPNLIDCLPHHHQVSESKVKLKVRAVNISQNESKDKDSCQNTNTSKPAAFKNYNDRLVACNGDCGSPLSKFIDTIISRKVSISLLSIIMMIEFTSFEPRNAHK